MLKKLFAFLGFTSLSFADGKANIEMTEEQMNKSAALLDERDAAVAENIALKEEVFAVTGEKDTAIAKINALQTENSSMKAENETLKNLPGSKTALAVPQTDGNATADNYKIITDTNKSVAEQLRDFTNALKN